MKRTELLLVVLLLLAAGGLVAAYLLTQGGQDPLPRPDLPKAPEARTASQPAPEPMVGEKPAEPMRTPVAGNGEGLRVQAVAQGLRGVVLDPFNRPVPGAEVMVCETFNPANFLSALARTRSMPKRRFNRVMTEANGAFVIGFDANVNADLYVRHSEYQTAQRGSVHVPSQGVEDIGVVTLTQGLVLGGIVRSAASGLPLEGATVRLLTPGANAFQVVPGEEDGTDLKTDAAGTFRFASLKPAAYTVEAFAKGHAKETRANVTVAEGAAPAPLEFALKQGLSIRGLVVDGEGKPVPDARVEAASYSVQNPLTSVARSDAEGVFEVLGLPEGAYRLTAQAEGYVEGKKNMAQAGDADAVITLQRMGEVVVQVLGRSGRPLDQYTLELRQVFPDQKVFGRTNVPEARVRGARQGRYTMGGITPGQGYVLRVEAPGYAMAFSEAFRVELGQAPPEVTVRLSAGGTLRGRVIDANGQPVAGAAVSTMSNEYDDNPFTAMFGALIPQQHTRAAATTNGAGEYTLKLIMPQTYQLKVVHKDFPTTYRKDLLVQEMEEGQAQSVPDIVLPLGVVVFGTAYDPTGQPVKGGKVTLQGEGDTRFGAEAATDEKGAFEFPAAPPGNYKIQVGRQQGVNNLFLVIVDFRKSEKQITLTGATRRQEVRLQIPP